MTEVRPQKKSRFRVLRTLLMGGAALLLVAVTGAYVFRDRITQELNARLAAQIREWGIHVEYLASDFAPFKGVKLSDIRLYRDASREVTVARLSKAELHFSLLGLVRDRSASLLRITSEDAVLELAGDSGSYAIGNLAADLLIDSQGTVIETLRGTMRDLEFALDGDLSWGSFAQADEKEVPDPAFGGSDPTTRVIDLSPVVRWLELIPDSPDGEINLDLTLSRPADPAVFSLSGRLAGKRVNWREIAARDVAGEFVIAPGSDRASLSLTFPVFEFGIDEGRVRASGEWDFASRQIRLDSLETDLNPASVAPLLAPEKRAVLASWPAGTWKASGILNLAEIRDSELKGSFSSADPTRIPLPKSQSLSVSDLAGEFSWEDRLVRVSGLTALLGEEGAISVEGDAAFRLRSQSGTDEGGARAIQIERFTMGRQGQTLSASGSYESAARLLKLESLESNLDLVGVLADLGWSDPISGQVRFSTPPAITLASLPPVTWKASGILNLAEILDSELKGSFSSPDPVEIPLPKRRALSVSDLAGEFSWEDRLVQLSGISALLGEEGAISVEGDAAFRLRSQSGTDEGRARAIQIERFTMGRQGQTLSASGSYESAARLLKVESLESNLDLAGVLADLGWSDPISGHVRFSTPPAITLAGTVALNSLVSGSTLTGTLQADRMTVFAKEGRVVECSNLSCGFALNKSWLKLGDGETAAFGGAIRLPDASIDLAARPVGFDGEIEFESLHLERLADVLRLEKRRTGRLTGIFKGKGSPDLSTLTGEGKIGVVDAEFNSIPLFRTLRPLFSAITLSDWGSDGRGTGLSASFEFLNGVMSSEDIALKGDFYEVRAAARVDFPREQLLANGHVTTTGATRVLAQVVGKTLEVEASGSFDDFTWRLKNIPGLGAVADLSGLSKDLIGKTLGAAASSGLPAVILNGVKGKGAAGLATDAIKEISGAGGRLFGIGKEKDKSKEPAPEAVPVPQRGPDTGAKPPLAK